MKLRIITGVIIACATLAMTTLGGAFLIGGLSIVGVVCSGELAGMISHIRDTATISNNSAVNVVLDTALENKVYASQPTRLIYYLSIISCVIIGATLFNNSQYRIYFIAYSLLSVVITLIRSHGINENIWLEVANTSMVTMILICSGLIGFYTLSQIHYWQLIYVISLTAISDVMGFFVGKKYGKAKIFHHISPKKTEYGTIAMLISPALVGVILSLLCSITYQAFWTAIGLLGLMGDLWISSIKRLANLKDTGTILPGHGGILDRIDSHILVLSVAWCVFV